MVEHLALHGSVTLLVLVDEKGGVADLKVNRVVCRQRGGQDVAVFGAREIKEFEGILGEAAKRSVTRWRFAPATKLGVPVRVWMPVEMQF